PCVMGLPRAEECRARAERDRLHQAAAPRALGLVGLRVVAFLFCHGDSSVHRGTMELPLIISWASIMDGSMRSPRPRATARSNDWCTALPIGLSAGSDAASRRK